MGSAAVREWGGRGGARKVGGRKRHGKGVSHLHKVGVLGIPDSDHGVHLLDQLLLLVIIELHVPLGQTRLACPVLDEDESDLEQAGEEMRDVGDTAQGGHHETFYRRDVGPRLSPGPAASL